MSINKQGGLFGSVMRHVRKLASALREKPQVALEDYVLEHFMLYHGLVGTSPEDQPQFENVRANVHEAILRKSPVEMAIALKLPPLWWEEKLQAIFAEAHQYREETIRCLMPPGNPVELVPEANPIGHPDWRVRSNAARTLGHLGVMEAIPNLVAEITDENLNEDDNKKASFCHFVYALSKLQSPQSRIALTSQLENPDPWLRVDAAGALAKWPLADVAPDLMRSLLTPHALADYAAVAISREHSPSELLSLSGDLKEGALEVIIGLSQAAQSTFANDTTFGDALESSFDTVYSLAKEKPSPRRLRALFELSEFIKSTSADEELIDKAAKAEAAFNTPQYADELAQYFADPNKDSQQLGHAIKLAARYKLKQVSEQVRENLKPDSPFLNESIETLGAIGTAEDAPYLVDLINSLVDLDDRTNRELNKQAVFEDDPTASKSYWSALRALGHIPSDEGIEMLLKASGDFAADKRQQALASLIANATENPEIRESHRATIIDRVLSSLDDPSTKVRIVAITGIENLALTGSINAIIPLIFSRSTGVARQARTTLVNMALNGHKDQIVPALQSALKAERDAYKRQRLQSMLDSITT